jgi:hypothetical protein
MLFPNSFDHFIRKSPEKHFNGLLLCIGRAQNALHHCAPAASMTMAELLSDISQKPGDAATRIALAGWLFGTVIDYDDFARFDSESGDARVFSDLTALRGLVSKTRIFCRRQQPGFRRNTTVTRSP